LPTARLSIEEVRVCRVVGIFCRVGDWDGRGVCVWSGVQVSCAYSDKCLVGLRELWVRCLVLPKINGTEACKRISGVKEDVPVIFATGYSPEMALLHNAQERELTILQKRYAPRELARRVRETLDRQPAKVHPG
jgi:DNA-binding response OmpR family regulator